MRIGDRCSLPAPALWLCLLWISPSLLPSAAEALTVYRLGGAGLPPPASQVPVDFVQLAWEDVRDDRFGIVQSVDVRPDSLTPERLDPEHNLTPSTLGGGITFLRRGIWEKPESVPQWWPDRFSVLMADEDDETFHEYARDMIYAFDLGRPVHLQRIRFYSPDDSHRTIPAFLIGTNDGDVTKDGTRPYSPPGAITRHEVGSFQRTGFYDFDVVHEGPGARLVELKFPQIPTRRLLFRIFSEGLLPWELVEFQIYASGFVPAARYTSNVLDLGGLVSLGSLSWSGALGQDPEAGVELRMRAGDDQGPNRYWRRTFRGAEQVYAGPSGRPLTRTQYDDLELPEKGDITHDAEHWDAWHATYDFAAGQGPSPLDRPRRFVQFDVAFTSTPTSRGRLDYLEFAASPYLVTRTRAEISPARAAAGEITSFTYKLRPELEPGDLGFDGLRIDTPAQVLSVEPVGLLNGTEVDLEIMRMDDEGFAVRIPRIDPARTQELLEINFQARIFEYDTPFTGGLFDSAAPQEVPQRVLQGDADELTDSRTTRVALTTIPGRSIRAMNLSSGVCTPNGDGVNDVVEISYQLVNVTGGVAAILGIYDLAGRKLGDVVSEPSAISGPVTTAWDGTDSQGRPLPPGIYVLQLTVETDTGEDRSQRLISLAY